MGLLDGLLEGSQFANSLRTGQNLSSQNQKLQDELQTYPQLLQAQLQQQQAMGGILGANAKYADQMGQAGLTAANLKNTQLGLQNQYYPQITQADIRSKNTYADLAPYTISSMLSGDPITQMAYNKVKILPQLVSNDGGMTIHPASTGLTAPPTQQPMQIPSDGLPQGVPYSQSATGGITGLPVLPGGLNAQQGQQLTQLTQPQSGGLTGLAASPVISTGIPGLDAMYQARVNNMMATMSKDPRFGSQRSGAGGTYVDPNTGTAITTDTTKNASTDQAAVAAISRVSPIINRLSTNLAPFQTLMGQSNLRFSQLENYLGANTDAGNKYAIGKSDLEKAPESLLKAYGLNVTNESLDSMRRAVEPRFGESPEGYQSRIMLTLDDLKQNQSEAAQRLQHGQVLNSSAKNNSGMDFNIPQFNNKKEFQSWYAGLTPDEQTYVYSKLKG